MRVGYVDSSCLVAIAFGEPGHETVVEGLEGLDQLYSSTLLEAELRATLQREGVGGEPSLLEHVAWVLPERPLSQEIKAVLRAGHLRGADLWHLASASYLSPDPAQLVFATLDAQQAAVAAAMGFDVMQPRAPRI